MTSAGRGTGGDHLARRSELTASRAGMPELKDVLIVEDENFDAERLRATLRVLFGYTLDVRRATTLGTALDAVIERKPDMVFLDDYLKTNNSATQSIPYLRRAGFEGPIVVVSGEVDKQRRSGASWRRAPRIPSTRTTSTACGRPKPLSECSSR